MTRMSTGCFWVDAIADGIPGNRVIKQMINNNLSSDTQRHSKLLGDNIWPDINKYLTQPLYFINAGKCQYLYGVAESHVPQNQLYMATPHAEIRAHICNAVTQSSAPKRFPWQVQWFAKGLPWSPQLVGFPQKKHFFVRVEHSSYSRK
ncbi:hypothetical protein XELAEV_18046927mg [Xenopus laevis]|uniref:Uncharacterized protein n=1 Tax=Xenopus laevis TaxID=8355 RepID=A0A974H129_XENLA|nr:hypothetical protein XELAEV_18046927mg [Xenopus laevis]